MCSARRNTGRGGRSRNVPLRPSSTLDHEEPANVTETIQVGSQVPDFTLNTYEPTTGDFGSVSLSDLKSSGKWTILFFYPADFTFV